MKQLWISGTNSDVSFEFIGLFLADNPDTFLTLLSSNEASAEEVGLHFKAKHGVSFRVIPLDLSSALDLGFVENQTIDVLFCASGYLGKDSQSGLYEVENTRKIIAINYGFLVEFLGAVAKVMENQRRGDIIVLSSVAGERGRQSNFVYGSAKAAITAYTSGLRNYLYKKNVHVLTVIPGFMATKMTQDLDLPPLLTSSPLVAAKKIYKAYLSKKNTLYVGGVWRYIMLVIKCIPEFVFKRLSL